jgi:hypothetical protein
MSRDTLNEYGVYELENFSYDLIEILKLNIKNSSRQKELRTQSPDITSLANVGEDDEFEE